jgi:putative ABC transport system permease protein
VSGERAPAPPRVARAMLLAAALPEDRWLLIDDLDEEFSTIAERDGAARAARWYWIQAVMSVPSLLTRRAARAVRALALPVASRRNLPAFDGHPRASYRRGDPVLRELWDDLRYATRRAIKHPLVAGTILVSTALAVGATTAVFSVVNGLLLRPLPLPEPDRIVRVVGLDSRFPDGTWGGVSFPNGNDIAARSRTLERVALYNQNWSGTLVTTGGPRSVHYTIVSGELAAVLGLRPALGRWFLPEEHRPGSEHVAILTHEGWQRELGGDPSIVGRTIRVDDRPYTVVGILPPMALEFPKEDLTFWAPLAPPTTGPASWRSGRSSDWLAAIARVQRGVTIEQANAELTVIGRQLAEEHPVVNRTRSYRAQRLQDAIVGPVRPMLWLLAAAVAGVLLVACGNVAMLLLANAETRRREFAVRAAIGGTGARVTRQVLTETMALTGVGGALGIVLAPVVVAAFLGIYPEPLPSRAQIVLDTRALAVALTVIGLAAVLAGLPAARQARRLELGDRLRDGSRAAGSRAQQRSGRLLIVGQVALSIVLLFGAGILVRSFWNLTRVELGFQPRGVLTFWLTPAGTRGRSNAAFFREVTAALRGLPGVREIATSYDIPTAARAFGNSVIREGKGDTPGHAPNAGVQMVSPRFFATMGIPLLAGRDLDDRDRAGAPNVVVVNESFAARLFPGENVLGRRITVWDGPHTVVGVVGDARRGYPLWDPPEPEMYFSVEQHDPGWRYVIIRTDGTRSPESLVPAARAVVRRLDPLLPLAELATLEERLRDATAPQRFRSALVGTLGALALLLSVVGIYGVVAYTVSRRTREIGIRIALGEAQRTIRARVVGQALGPAIAGVAAGVGAAIFAARWLESFVLGVAPRDATTLAAVSALFLAVTVLAAYAPARRASRIDPTVALRTE